MQGTLYFMAAEAMECEYLFLPLDYEGEGFEQRIARLQLSEANNDQTGLAFCHNGLHDVESVWWCGVYLFFFNRFKDVEESDKQVEARQSKTKFLFPDFALGGERRNRLTNRIQLMDAFLTLNWTSRNKICKAADVVIRASKDIVTAYLEFEALIVSSAERVKADPTSINRSVKKAFAGAEVAFDGETVVPVKLTLVDAPINLHRID